MNTPTTRQQRVLTTIASLTRKNKLPPTIREIGTALKMTINGVTGHLKALRRKGLIEQPKGRQKSRGIVLANQSVCPCCGRERE